MLEEDMARPKAKLLPVRRAPRDDDNPRVRADYRLPPDLKQWLEERAERNRRTATYELERILSRIRAKEGKDGPKSDEDD